MRPPISPLPTKFTTSNRPAIQTGEQSLPRAGTAINLRPMSGPGMDLPVMKLPLLNLPPGIRTNCRCSRARARTAEMEIMMLIIMIRPHRILTASMWERCWHS